MIAVQKLMIYHKKINFHNYFINFTKFGLQNSKNFYPKLKFSLL